jgi:hypothetical protein
LDFNDRFIIEVQSIDIPDRFMFDIPGRFMFDIPGRFIFDISYRFMFDIPDRIIRESRIIPILKCRSSGTI